MAEKRSTPEQIVAKLRQVEGARAAGLRRGPDGDGAALRDPWGTAITLVSG